MSRDSAITPFDWSSLGQEPKDKLADCTFWTGMAGQMCVQYFRPEASVFYPPHVHSEYTIVVCLAGEVSVKQLGQEQTIGPGEVLMGNHGVPHSSDYRTQNGRACEAVSVSVDRRLMAGLTGDFAGLPWTKATCPAFLGKARKSVFRDCAREIAEELKNSRSGRKILIENQATRLLVETMRAWPRPGITEMETDSSQRLPRSEFVRACEFMRRCRKEDFRLQFLCRFLGSSEERFTRLFLASTDQTPASFYNRMLLDRACDLLANPSLSIKEVAFELGFKTSSHFVTAFRRVNSLSPQKYREQFNSNPQLAPEIVI